jgi:molecular chaperone DnaK (HSP70)
MNPQMTIFDIKRLICRAFNDPTVTSDRKLWPFSVVAGANNVLIWVVAKTLTSE